MKSKSGKHISKRISVQLSSVDACKPAIARFTAEASQRPIKKVGVVETSDFSSKQWLFSLPFPFRRHYNVSI